MVRPEAADRAGGARADARRSRRAIDAWQPILRVRAGAPRTSQAARRARLRRLVWSPLEEHLARVATVLVSPDGALGLVPLGCCRARRRAPT